jgi:hypothetical protein
MVILGKNVIFSVLNSSGVYQPICCCRTAVLSTQTDISGKSTIGSGIWKENKGIVNGWTIKADGVVSIVDNMNLFTLRTYQFNLTPVLVNFESSDEDGNSILYTGSLIITGVDESKAYNDISTYSMQGIGDGRLSMIYTNNLLGDIFYGFQDSNADPVDFTKFISGDPSLDILIDYGSVPGAKYFWMAHSISAGQKTNWEDENDINNGGIIGQSTDLFEVRQITILGEVFLLYITKYATRFTSNDQRVKFFIQILTCLPPINFAISSVTNNSPTDTGALTELSPVTLTFGFVNAGSFKTFTAQLSQAIDADINITKVFADGFSDTTCTLSAVASAQFNNLTAFQILTGGTGSNKDPESTSGTWTSAIRYRVYNVIVNGNSVLDGNFLTIGSYQVKMVIPGCI